MVVWEIRLSSQAHQWILCVKAHMPQQDKTSTEMWECRLPAGIDCGHWPRHMKILGDNKPSELLIHVEYRSLSG